jgi:hypothetical protein
MHDTVEISFSVIRGSVFKLEDETIFADEDVLTLQAHSHLSAATRKAPPPYLLSRNVQ